jgi:hypothetical protein
MSEYKAGYRSEVATFERAVFERAQYEDYLQMHDLIELKGKVDRGEPTDIDSRYGGVGYQYYLPDEPHLGRVKVTIVNGDWNFEWEDRR